MLSPLSPTLDRPEFPSPFPHTAFSKTNILGKDAGKEEHDKIWEFSYRLALEVLVDFGLPDEALDKIFCTNAEAFYGAA